MGNNMKYFNSNRYCSVPQCKSRCTKDISLFKFPSDQNLVKKWADALKIGKKVSKYMYVCSLHFSKYDFFLPDAVTLRRRLKKGVIPSQNIPQESFHTKQINKTLVRNARILNQHLKQSSSGLNNPQHVENQIDMEIEVKEEPLENLTVIAEKEPIQNIIQATSSKPSKVDVARNARILNQHLKQSSSGLNNPQHVENQIDFEVEVKEEPLENLTVIDERKPIQNIIQATSSKPFKVEVAVEFDEKTFNSQKLSIKDLITSDKQLNAFTGIVSFKLLENIVKGVDLVEKSIHKKLSTYDCVLLTFIKLKLNISFICISALFGVSINSCKNYFHRTIQSLKLSLMHVIRFPDKKEILQNMPIFFDNFKNTRIVLDCTEIATEKFKCLNCCLKTCSHYNGTNTVKILIGCTPSGMISFVSKAYGGHVSDEEILLNSDLLNKCLPGQDAIMVDEGFRIEAECAQYNLKLIRPPFLSNNKQLSASDALATAEIASARVIVERSIQRIKIFKILKGPISQNLLPYIDDIMIVIAGIVNLTAPLLNEDKF